MKTYKIKDFYLKDNKNEISTWESSDRQFHITTSTHSEARYFVYISIVLSWEYIGINELSLSSAIEELNKMITNGEIEKYI